jgi:hypothetical protein
VSKVVEESTERDALTGKGGREKYRKESGDVCHQTIFGLGNQEIGSLFGGMHYSAASKPFARLEKAMKDNKALRNLVKGIVSNART